MPNSAVSQTGFLDPPTRSQAAAQSYPIYCSVCLEDNVITEDVVTVSADHGTIVHVTKTQVLGEPNLQGSVVRQVASVASFGSLLFRDAARVIKAARLLPLDHSMEKTTCIRKRLW